LNGGWIVAAAYDTKLANQFVERFGAAFRARDIDAIAALLHPEGRESQRDFFLSFLKATCNYAWMSATVKPFEQPNSPIMRNYEYHSTPVATVLALIEGQALYNKQTLDIQIAPAPDGSGYCAVKMFPKTMPGPSLVTERGEFDGEKFRVMVRDATRRTFTALRQKHPKETFYAFALYSDEDGMTMLPAANSEERLQAKVKERGADKKGPEYVRELRWATPEWAYEGAEADDFDLICDKLAAIVVGDKPIKGGRAKFKKQVFETAVEVLADLDAEGLFGQGAARQRITLFFTNSESGSLSLERKTARRLNPASVYKRFWA
jgi:hypothetical protein